MNPPPHIIAALERYRDNRLPTGSFLRAVIANDLLRAIQCADSQSLEAIGPIVYWAKDHLPEESKGNYARIKAWLEKAETDRDE